VKLTIEKFVELIDFYDSVPFGLGYHFFGGEELMMFTRHGDILINNNQRLYNKIANVTPINVIAVTVGILRCLSLSNLFNDLALNIIELVFFFFDINFLNQIVEFLQHNLIEIIHLNVANFVIIYLKLT
jgi:hypothetical protein